MPGSLLPFQSNEHQPYSSPQNHPRDFNTSSNRRVDNSIFTRSSQKSTSTYSTAANMSSSTTPAFSEKKSYAPSISSISSTKPLLNSSSSSKSQKPNSFRSKTKKFLSSIGEPPSLEWQKEQVAAGKMTEQEIYLFNHMPMQHHGRGGPYHGAHLL